MWTQALESGLNEVLQLASQAAADVPLAIRRFVTHIGAKAPEEAIQWATAELLDRYMTTYSAELGPVSVERLCAASGVELKGFRPTQRRHSSYSLEASTWKGNHSGMLDFTQSGPVIQIPPNFGFERARVTVAHEIGHVLIYQRSDGYDLTCVRLGTSSAEEALAEYAARLLLLPRGTERARPDSSGESNLAVQCLQAAQRARVTIHAAVARLGDPDVANGSIRGAILWRMKGHSEYKGVHEALTPHWHLCPNAFIPVHRSRAREGSLIADVASRSESFAAGSCEESVSIGTLKGNYVVDAFAWGSVRDKTRLVLSVFREPCAPRAFHEAAAGA